MSSVWRNYGELQEAPNAGARNWGLAVGIGVLVFLLWVNLDFQPLAFQRGDGFDPTANGRISIPIAAIRLAENIVDSVKAHRWDGDDAGRIGLDADIVRSQAPNE